MQRGRQPGKAQERLAEAKEAFLADRAAVSTKSMDQASGVGREHFRLPLKYCCAQYYLCMDCWVLAWHSQSASMISWDALDLHGTAKCHTVLGIAQRF